MTTHPGPEGAPNPPAPKRAARILVVDADTVLLGLLDQWLEGAGFEVVHRGAGEASRHGQIDLAIVDVPRPRLDAAQVIGRIVTEHPGTPILAVSSAFLPGIERCCTAPQTLGVSGVLAKPMTQETLMAQVHRLLR